MDNQDHKRTHIPAHESHGVHLCHKCGWPFPNPHPSAKHRRSHKRICGTIEGYKLLDSGEHTHSNASDDSDDDHKIPSPNASEMSKNEKGVGGIGEKVNRSEDEVFSDAVADFSDSGLSSDSTISVEKVDRKDPKYTSEVKGSDAAGVSQSIVKLSDNFQMHSPEVSLSEGAEVGKALELQGQPSGFVQESSSISDSNSRTEASTVVHSDDSLGLLSNSHISKASKVESMSDVIPETGENVTDCSSTYVVEETNLKGKDDSESDRDMVEIPVSSNNVVGEISERLSKVEVSDEGTSGGEVADGAATLKEKNRVELSSVLPRDDLLPLDVDSVVNTNAPTNVVQLESEYMSQFATSSDPVKAFQEKEEGDVNVHTLSNPDLAHSQSEFEDYKGPEGKGVALQDPLSLHPSEGLKHEEGDLKEAVTEEYNSSFDSNQLTEEKEVLSLDMHVLDDSIKQGCINSEPMVEVIPEVSSVKHTVDGDQRSIEIGTSENSVKSEITNTCTGDSFERPGSDDVGKNLQHINLPEDRVMVSSYNFEDFKDCMEEVPQNPLNNLHSSEALKDKEDDLKDTVSEESHSNFNLSQMNKESEVISPDMHVLDDSIKQEQVHSVAKVEDTLEERTVLPPVTLTAESNKKSDEIGASEINVNREKNESHVVHVLGEQKLDDVCKTAQEKNFPEDSVMASSNENSRDVSNGSSTGQISVVSIGDISHYEKNTSELDDVALDSKFRGGNKESIIGIKGETIQPSDFLQLEAKTSSDVIKSDYAGERGKIAECDEINTQGTEGPLVKDNSLPNSGSSQIEFSIVSEDMIDGYARKSTGIESTSIDAVSATKEDIKGDKIINNDKVLEECNRFVGTFSSLHQAQDTELSSKTVDNHAGELLSHSPLDTEQSAQSVPAVEPSGEASGISIVTAQDRSSNNLVKFGSSRIDASVESNSRCDSLEGNWGSVSVLSVQSDAPPIMDGEALPLAEGGKSNMNGSKAAPEGQRSEKSEMFEPPSFMTLVEPGHVVGQKADASEAQKGHNPQQPNPNSSQAGWFPTLTQVVNESQGRKKNEEIIAKVTNWSTSKQHTPLKNLLGEAANSSKPKSPKLEENQASPKNGKVPKDNGSGLTTVNSILGPESPSAQAVKGEVGKEWNSPARYPADIKREKRKVKSRPYWIQFVCCSSVDPQ